MTPEATTTRSTCAVCENELGAVVACGSCLVDVTKELDEVQYEMDELRDLMERLQDLIADHRRGLISDTELYDGAGLSYMSKVGLGS